MRQRRLTVSAHNIALREGRTMRRLLAAATAAALAIVPATVRADGYPEQVYTSVSPSSDDWLALVGQEGRWAIQVGEGCPWIAAGLGMNVMLSAPVDADGGAMLVVPDTPEF